MRVKCEKLKKPTCKFYFEVIKFWIFKSSEQVKKAEAERKAKVSDIVKRRNKGNISFYYVTWTSKNQVAKRVQNFWGDSLINHPWLQNLVGDDDVEIFGYLKELHVDDEIEKKRTIRFKFGENPYFKNEELIKTYVYEDDEAKKITTKTHSKVKWKGQHDKANLDEEQSPFFTWFEDDSMGDHHVADVFANDFYLYAATVSESFLNLSYQ